MISFEDWGGRDGLNCKAKWGNFWWWKCSVSWLWCWFRRCIHSFQTQWAVKFLYTFVKIVLCGSFLKSVLNFLQYHLCFWFFDHKACRSSAPQPRIEPAPPALVDKVLTTGPPRKSLNCKIFNNCSLLYIIVHESFWILIFSGYMPSSEIAGA